jgi:hypothetical protein
MESLSNFNVRNAPDNSVFDAFNKFIFSKDIKVIGKLLHRFRFFEMVKDLPGDIVEVGVFKGSGVASFQKFIELFCPNSIKKVIGFDIFDVEKSKIILSNDSAIDKSEMIKVYDRVEHGSLTLQAVTQRLSDMNLNSRAILVDGDITESMPVFVKENPGFRISLLYIDVDLERPTYVALKNLWDRVLPGGVVVFDEYEFHKFSESTGVEKFLKEMNIEYTVKSTHFMGPTAFIVKT